MATVNQDFLLRFILDQSSQQKTKAGVDALTGDISDVDKIVRAATKDFELLEKQINEASSPKEFDALEKKLKAVDGQVKDITKNYQLQARVARAEAAAMVDGYEKARVARIKAFGDRLGGASRTGLVASGALFAGVFAEANRFAKEAEETGKATRATREWTAATKELAQARSRVDTVLLREALPLLQQAAELAGKTSEFIETHPELVRAALETGKIVAGLSVLGVLASKGIALYADAKAILLGTQELAAAKLQDVAANKQLAAARLQMGVGGAPTGPTAATGASALGTAGLLTGGVAASALISKSVSDNIIKLGVNIAQLTQNAQAGASVITTMTAALTPLLPILPGIQSLKANLPQVAEILSKLGINIDQLGKQSQKTADDLNQAASGLAGSAHESEVVAAFQKWKEDDARIVQEAADQRVRIVADAEQRVVAETAKFASQVSRINAGADKRAETITSNFYKAQAESEARYQEQRARLIKDGAQEIRDIQEAHQERLRKLEQEHDERVEGLVSARDALGLAKENKRFAQAKAEENKSTREEIAKRKQQLAERLQQLAQEHQAEQAQRYADFQQQLADNEAQRQEELKEAAAAHAEELKQIREQKAAQLREVTAQLTAERLRRQQYFIAQIRDLDATLLGERNTRTQYYNLMLADVDRWLADYRTRLASLSTATPPDHDFTGYAYSGMYRMAANGQPEYVLSGAATRAAEKMIGGGLTQDAVLSALARGSGRSGSLTIQDNSRFDGRISASQIREIKRETRSEILRDLGLGRN